MASAVCLLVLACVILSCAFACPSEQYIHPCRCEGYSIVCKGIAGQDILDGVLRGMVSSPMVYKLVLSDSQVDHIPVSAIEEKGIQKISVHNSAIRQLFEKDPSTRNVLLFLELINVTLQNGLPVSQIKPLQHLEYLDIRDTEIPVIEREFSESLSQKIKMVHLDNTKTRIIDLAFVGKINLQNVIIHKTSLKTLERHAFPYPSRHLQHLSLNWNQIETLPDDMFDLMYALRVVSLRDNRISQVSKSVFGPVLDQLMILDLDGNPINCDCSIKWLTMRDNKSLHLSGKCAVNQSLAGRNIAHLKPPDFPNC